MENKSKFFENFYKSDEYVNETQIVKGRVIHNYTYQVGNLAVQEGSKTDMYFTPNTLFPKNGKFQRVQGNVSRLKFLYTDLDCYTLNMHPELVLEELEQDYFNRTIPCPNLAIYSGRGMYLLWYIDEHSNALPRWKRCQQGIYEVLKDFGADPKVVTDSARLLRMIGSVNSKSGETVSIIREYSQDKQSLYWIQNEFLDFAKEKNKSVKREIKNHGKLVFFSDANTLLQTRLADLETLLLKHRDYEGSGRENILFLYRYWTLAVNGQNKEDALNATLKLNSKMKHPLPEIEVIKATKSAEKAYQNGEEGKYRYKNSTLISQLQITEEEMKDMRSLTSPEVLKKRQKTRSRRAYLRRLEAQGKEIKSVEINDRRKAVKSLYERGMTYSNIANKLEVSVKTIQRDIAFLRENDMLNKIVPITKTEKLDKQTAPHKQSKKVAPKFSKKESRVVKKQQDKNYTHVLYARSASMPLSASESMSGSVSVGCASPDAGAG